MPYAQRDLEGRVIGLYANPQPQPDGTDLAPDWLAEDDPEVSAFLGLGGWASLAAATGDLAGRAKAEADRRVAAISPPDRQLQHTAMAVRLLDVAALRPLTAEEQQTQAWLRAASDAITAIRLAEAAHHSAIAALATLEAAQAYDLAAGWPG